MYIIAIVPSSCTCHIIYKQYLYVGIHNSTLSCPLFTVDFSQQYTLWQTKCGGSLNLWALESQVPGLQPMREWSAMCMYIHIAMLVLYRNAIIVPFLVLMWYIVSCFSRCFYPSWLWTKWTSLRSKGLQKCRKRMSVGVHQVHQSLPVIRIIMLL